MPIGMRTIAPRSIADDLISYVRERVAHFKVPRSVDFVDELPRTPTGKLVKGKLKAAYAS